MFNATTIYIAIYIHLEVVLPLVAHLVKSTTKLKYVTLLWAFQSPHTILVIEFVMGGQGTINIKCIVPGGRGACGTITRYSKHT
jgi:hypothetical protein